MYWLNLEGNKNNFVTLSNSTIIVGTVAKEDIDKIEADGKDDIQSRLKSLLKDVTPISIDSITLLKSDNTDETVEIEYKDKKENDTSLEFKDIDSKQQFLAQLNRLVPEHMVLSVVQKTTLGAALSPALSLTIAVTATVLFARKIPMIAYIVGGIWALLSLIMLIRNFRSPPEITTWKPDTGKMKKSITWIKTAYRYAIVLATVVGLYLAIPDHEGPAIIHQSAENGMLSSENLESLIARGGDINYQDEAGQTPLHLMIDTASNTAFENGQKMAGRILLNAAGGNTAVTKPDNPARDAAIALIQHGANLEIEDNYGQGALAHALSDYAEYALSWELFDALLEAGADANIQMLDESMSAVDYAREYATAPLFDDRNLADVIAEYTDDQ